MRAIVQGECAPNPPGGADAPGEDGAQEPDIDDEAQAPIEIPLGAIPRDALALRPRHKGPGTVLKQTSDDEGHDCRDYTWNWEKPRGGPPWQDVEDTMLSTAEKTHLLQNVYVINCHGMTSLLSFLISFSLCLHPTPSPSPSNSI